MRHNFNTAAVTFLVFGCAAARGAAQQVGRGATGIFETHSNVGVIPKPGSVDYDSASGEYRVTGGGANIWSTADAFQFAWSRLSGDVTLTADIRFIGTGKVNHRKAVLMIRQGLEPGAAYADVALHGDGLTSLQFRPTAGAETEEVKAEVNAPRRIRIDRRGNVFTMFAGNNGEALKAAGDGNGGPAGSRVCGDRRLFARRRSNRDSGLFECPAGGRYGRRDEWVGHGRPDCGPAQGWRERPQDEPDFHL